MVAPIIFVILALIAAPPATDILAGDNIDSNSPAALQALERFGELATFRARETRINERKVELQRAKTQTATERGIKNLDRELASTATPSELLQRNQTLNDVRNRLQEKNLTKAVEAITNAMNRPYQSASRNG